MTTSTWFKVEKKTDLRAMAAAISQTGHPCYVALGKNRKPTYLGTDKNDVTPHAHGSRNHTEVWENGRLSEHLSTYIVLQHTNVGEGKGHNGAHH